MERQALEARIDVLRQERDLRRAQAVLQQRQIDDQIAALKQQLAKAEEQRASVLASAERDDYAYEHLIKEIERWLAVEAPSAEGAASAKQPEPLSDGAPPPAARPKSRTPRGRQR